MSYEMKLIIIGLAIGAILAILKKIVDRKKKLGDEQNE